MQNVFDSFDAISRLERAKEIISESGDRSIETYQTEKEGEE